MGLAGDDLDKVKLVLASQGWNEVMRPALVRRGNEAMKALALTRTERGSSYRGTDFDTDDDVLRAIIRDCTWMTVCWQNEVAMAEHNRRLEEQQVEANA